MRAAPLTLYRNMYNMQTPTALLTLYRNMYNMQTPTAPLTGASEKG